MLHGGQQLLQRDGLLKEVQRANLRGLHGRVDRGVAGHHDDRHRQVTLCRPFLEQADAIGIRHPDIEQYQIGRPGRTVLACLLGVFRHFDHMAFVTQDLRE
ncbi:hypothetical protein D3C85_1496870 [compost metagenome]